jgi:hypothetical protein
VEESPGLKAFWFVVFFVGLKPHASTGGGLSSALSRVSNVGNLRHARGRLWVAGLFEFYDRWNRRSFPFTVLKVRMTRSVDGSDLLSTVCR